MIINSKIKYTAPSNYEDFNKALSTRDCISLFAGGTDLVALFKFGVKNPDCLVDISKLPNMKDIEIEKDYIFIGAGVTLDNISKNIHILKHLPSVSYSAKCVASPQIRNTATIGGNILQDRRCIYFNQTALWRSSIAPCFKTGGVICHQAPNSQVCKALYYSDMAPVLIAANAKALVVEDGKEKFITVENLVENHVNNNGILENRKTLIKGFKIPVSKNNINKFYKYSIRQSIDFPVMNIAINYNKTSTSFDNSALKIIIGAVSPLPIELLDTEKSILAYIKNNTLSIDKICNDAVEEISNKSNIVRESGLSLKSKRYHFKNIIPVIREFIDNLNTN